MSYDSLRMRLYRWLQTIRMLNCTKEAPFIPLTKEEIEILVNHHTPGVAGYFTGDSSPRAFGLECRETSYAIMMRQRMLTMPITRLQEDTRVPLLDAILFRREIDHENSYLHRSIIAHVCTDTTNLLIRMEWDCFARLKRFLRITKWFPVKSRTVAVKGTILYPYLTVSLPHNAHYVQFAVSPS